MAEADRADPYKRLPLKIGKERAAVVPLGDPFDGAFYVFIPETQLLGPMAAVLRYSLFEHYSSPNMPCAQDSTRGGAQQPWRHRPPRIQAEALVSYTDVNNLFRAQPEGSSSEAGATIEFLGATAHVANSRPNNLEDLPLPAGRRAKLVHLVDEMSLAGSASIVRTQKLVGDLRSARTAATCPPGTVASKPLHHSIAGRGGKISC